MTLSDTSENTSPSSPTPRRDSQARLVVVLGVIAVLALVALISTSVVFSSTSAEPEAAEPVAPEPPAPAAEPVTAGQDPDELLSWAPPELEDPEVVEITEDDSSLRLDQERDYELRLPDEPLEAGLSVFGGRNVVLIGGEIRRSDTGEEDGGSRGLYLRDQTGTVHVEGVAITGDGLGEGINLDQRTGAVVQLQNIHVSEVRGSRDGHHADLIQTWAGPRQLLIDGLTGTTQYQGFFLLPKQFGDQPEPELFDLRRVDISAAEEGAAYMLWRDDLDWPLQTTDVYVAPQDGDGAREDFLWDREGEDSWADVTVGRPDGGPFVPEGVAGVGYDSPGYREAS